MASIPTCLYNHELLILFTSETPYQSYREPVSEAQARGYVQELADTQIDALMCCPTAWRAVLWPSDVDPRWREEDADRVAPASPCEMKYSEKAYWRVQQYMVTGADPVRVTRDSARDIGLTFFFSYRMNDHHHLWNRDCPTHDRFWREHPEFQMNPERGSYFNYLHPEVRAYYLALLTELVERYDPEGFELDFMRSPSFFPASRVEEGTALMTEFVRDVRAMLDRNRGTGPRKLLSVRVPRTLDECAKVGLDVLGWDQTKLVDMVNVSSYFISTHEIDIEDFRDQLEHAKIYGEMHFITDTGRVHPSGYRNNYSQKTTREQYETLAYEYWQRGVDGLSLFNFSYCREHHFGEPRRRGFPGVAPPFDMLDAACAPEQLGPRAKHYFINSNFDKLPISLGLECSASVDFDLHADPAAFQDAMLRVEMAETAWGMAFDVALNGQVLEASPYVGELFTPFTRESLPDHFNVENYRVPPALVRAGRNVITITRRGESAISSPLVCRRLELALYPYALPPCMTGA